METLYTGHIHGFPPATNISYGYSNAWGSQGGLVALGVVLGSSVSLVGLAFAFITYSLFSDLRSLAGTTLLSLLASLFMGQLLFVIGVGGIQDPELCLSLSLALLFMKLASLAWLVCCCHHALSVFRTNSNLVPQPEPKMGKMLAHYSLVSWGLPLLMLGVAAAFKYKEHEIKLTGSQVLDQLAHEVAASSHCWLMDGTGYIWGFLVPAVILLFSGYYLAAQANGAIKISAGLQVDLKVKNKMIRKRGLQIGLFVKLLIVLTIVIFFGAMAAIYNKPELWALYSVAQGVQGLVIAMLVSCNCRVLKLYSSPRTSKSRRGHYRSLREGEGGRYGVLSITNPNYEDIGNTCNLNGDEGCMVKMGYTEDGFIERSDFISTSPTDMLTGELSTALPVKELGRNVPIAPV
uniref:CSON009896 protein n=1 Tax=Culicoides sonorensis TaxID=179676 RepID=A0A336M3Q6_CULSO